MPILFIKIKKVLHSQLPAGLLSSLEGVNGFDAGAFEKVHADARQVTSVRFNPGKVSSFPSAGPGGLPETLEKIPWSSMGYYLEERPSFTFDPVFHGGAYYVQEASSMFLEQALQQTVDLSRQLRVLDLCAAPGGKSTLISSLLSADSLLVSNEVIRTRVNVLQENMVKWGNPNIILTNNDPRDLGRMHNYFDVIVVDAPCSGSGLFRRDPEAVREWSEDNVQLCCQRQQRILADCWPALKQDGILIYSTCSFSRQENEDILDWMMEELQAESYKLQVEEKWGIIETTGKKGAYGYRFYPDQLKGEGFFIACLRKPSGEDFSFPKYKRQAIEKLSRQEEERMKDWIKQGDTYPVCYFKHNDLVHVLPGPMMEDLFYLQSNCYLKKAGLAAGQLAAKEFIPEHDLALSILIRKEIPAISLTKEEAIQYLRKEEIRTDSGYRGWALVQYNGYNLGWVKILPNRVNNYYPKEWRILKRD
ncbi:methyltransferase RsmF C-terminal domain-like protein [Flavitalea flava]